MERFQEGFKYLIRKTFSYFDVGENRAENFYHAFILGLLVNLDDKYRIKSNTESGDGRANIMIIPEDRTKMGVIIEFKVARSKEEKIMAKIAREALDQIERMGYQDELKFNGIKEILQLAIVFKDVYIDYLKTQV
jgi:hypothetical protein